MAAVDLGTIEPALDRALREQWEERAIRAKLIESLMPKTWAEELVAFMESLLAEALIARHGWEVRVVASEQVALRSPTFRGVFDYGP